MNSGAVPESTPQMLICPICANHTFEPFFQLNEVPVQDGLLWNSREEALNSPIGNISLAFCQDCGYIGNLTFEPDKIRYDPEYSFSLHFSPTYQNFIMSLANRLVSKYDLQNKTVLEIGCGRGDFLRPLCEFGDNRGVGIDPSVTSHEEAVGSNKVTFIRDFYSEKYAGQDSDFICCRQVLDQLANPKAFIDMVRDNIGQRADTVIYFEVPNASNIFQDMLIRNVIYEKCSWFTPYSLTRLFELSGFEVLAAEPCYEAGQYLGIEAVPTSQPKAHSRSEQNGADNFKQIIASFAESYRHKVESWQNQLTSIHQTGQRTIAWGAGSGAISFFNTLKIYDQVPYVVDINPNRQGKFLPLTGQQVVSPEFIQEFNPDIVIITNPTYENEIKQQIANLGVQCNYWSI